MLNITTKFVHNDLSGPKIVAKGAGKQRTVAYDHSLSSDANHGVAAGTLMQALDVRWNDETTHEVMSDNRHRFSIPV